MASMPFGGLSRSQWSSWEFNTGDGLEPKRHARLATTVALQAGIAALVTQAVC